MEEWKDVPGYEGFYQASDLGRVRSLDRYIKRSRGCVEFQFMRGRILTLKTHNGYKIFSTSVHGNITTHGVHRIIALTYIPNPEGKKQVNHINCDKSDNRVLNLEWATAMENITHSVANKLNPRGERCGASKLNEQQVIEIRKLISDGLTNKEIAPMYNVSDTLISCINTGKIWTHI